MGGSNQTIIGASGRVAVNDTTAVRVVDSRIYFETGELGEPPDFSKSTTSPCSYGFIDTQRNTKVFADNGGKLQNKIVRILQNPDMSVSRSCAAR
jgi:hypothetical protein